MNRLSVLALWGLLHFTSVVFGQAFIEHLSPPSVQPGKVTRLTVRGSHLKSAFALWNSLPRGLVQAKAVGKPEANSAVFEVRVARNAPRGIYGLRVATRDGLSNAHLFVIDDLSTVSEDEPANPPTDDSKSWVISNNRFADAQLITLPAAVAGTCRPEDIDHFAFDVQAGQRVSIEVVGSRLGKAFDPVVSILDSKGNEIRTRENDQGLFFDSRFQHRFKKAGRYVIAVHDARFHGSPHWTYLLRLGKFPTARVAVPSTAAAGKPALISFPQSKNDPRELLLPPHRQEDERLFIHIRNKDDDASSWVQFAVSSLPNSVETEPNDKPQKATEAKVPGNIHGLMNKANDWDFFALSLKKGQRLSFRAETRGMGSAADLELTLFDPKGKAVKTADDSGFEDATFNFDVPTDGRYVLKVLEVVRQGGRAYAYRIEVRTRRPAIGLTSEIGRIAIPQGSWQPLPLKIARTDIGGPVQLQLQGVPEGVTLESNTIAATENEWVGRIRVAPTTPPGVYTLQVTGQTKSGKLTASTTAVTRPLIDRLPTGRGPHGEPFELREDQRRLPPTLTNRIALVVLEPAPFDFRVTAPEFILPRYSEGTFSFETTRKNGFDAPIQFAARGGTLEYNRLQPPPVKAMIPDLKPGSIVTTTAQLRSGVQTPIQRHRVTLTGTTQMPDGRVVNLTRTFHLKIDYAFRPAAEASKIKLAAGQSRQLTIHANRLGPYLGSIQVTPNVAKELSLTADRQAKPADWKQSDPLVLQISPGGKSVRATLQVAAGTTPGKYKLEFTGTSRMGKFFEEAPASALEVEVTAPPKPSPAPAKSVKKTKSEKKP